MHECAFDMWRIHFCHLGPNTRSCYSSACCVLTRATVRWSKLKSFWREAPSISNRIGTDKNVMFKIGLGEVPIRQQLTFSIWKNLTHMQKFAHQSGSHKDAILKVRDGDWFSEELYARFNVIEVKGDFSEFNQRKQEKN